MAYERLRLGAAALLWAGAGAVAHAADDARGWTAVAALAVAGAATAWPLGRTRSASPSSWPSEPPPSSAQAPSIHRLQARLDHLPVAAWVLTHDRLQALSSRAHRLASPAGVRDRAALEALLRGTGGDRGRAEGGAVVLDTERGEERWLLRRQALSNDGQAETLIALIPLEHELELESLDAWRQLVQVLTHEIMNSLTPIRSLSGTAVELLDDPAIGSDASLRADLRQAVHAVALRAQSLADFVATYREVSRWPAPRLAPVDLEALFARLRQSVAPDWAARGGEARFETAHTGLRLMADEGQLEQALIALIANAAQATAAVPAPRLWVEGRQGRGGRLHLSVRDNGPGVEAGLERRIFLPFFTTRAGGQGIGLTVVRQLVHGMGGRVRHVRPMAGGASFVLVF
jgi:signal transduction histidine kinase